MRVLVIGFALLLTAGTTAYSDFIDIVDEWYTSDSFLTMSGFHEKDCDGYTTDWGTTSDWRHQVVTGCNTGNALEGCWHWDGSSWQEVDCPTYAYGRLRVPIGDH